MTIFVRILMLLACGPLLQPPGFCVCKVEGFGHPSAFVNDGFRLEASSCPRKSTSCCSHSESLSSGKSVSATNEQTGGHQPPWRPTPYDDHHLPGCPASPGVDRYKVSETGVSFAHLWLPVLGVVTLVEHRTAITVRPSYNPFRFASSSPPLYLSHCALVI